MKHILWAFCLFLGLTGCDTSDLPGAGENVLLTTIGPTTILSDEVVLSARFDTTQSPALAEAGFVWGAVGDAASTGQRLTAAWEGAPTFSATLGGLAPQTEYWAMAYLEFSDGSQLYGKKVDFRTLPQTEIILGEPAYSDLGTTWVTVSVPLLDDSGVPPAFAGVQYWATETSEGENFNPELIIIPGVPQNPIFKGEDIVFELTDLEANTAYTVQLFAQNASEPVYASQLDFRTLDYSLPVVGTPLTPDAVTGSTMTFTVPLDNGMDPTCEYGMIYRVGRDGTMPDSYESVETEGWMKAVGSEISEAGTFTLTLAGLENLTEYSVAAYARNRKGFVLGERIFASTVEKGVPLLTTIGYAGVDFDTLISLGGTDERPVGEDYIYMQGQVVMDGEEEVMEYGFDFSTTPDMSAATEIRVDEANVDSQSGRFFHRQALPTVSNTEGAIRYYYRAYLKTADAKYTGEVASTSPAVCYDHAGSRLYYLVPNADTGVSSNNPAYRNDEGQPLYYYELPPVRGTEGGAVYDYFFLDRNLGALQLPTESDLATPVSSYLTETLLRSFGYYYQFGYGFPAMTDWVDSNISAPYVYYTSNANKSWAAEANPCPKGYDVPTRMELEAVLANYNQITDLLNFWQALLPIYRNINGYYVAQKSNPKIGIMLKDAGYVTYTGTSGSLDGVQSLPLPQLAGLPNQFGVPVRCVRKVAVNQ